MFAHVHSQVFSAWGFDDRPIEWGVPWTGVDPYADSLENAVVTDGLMRPLKQEPGFGNMLNREWALSQPHDDPQGILEGMSGGGDSTDDMAVPAGYAGIAFRPCRPRGRRHRRRQRPRRGDGRSATRRSASTSCWPTSTWRAPRRPAPPSQRKAARREVGAARRHRPRRLLRARRPGRWRRTARSTSWSTAPARPSAAPPRNSPKNASTSSSISI